MMTLSLPRPRHTLSALLLAAGLAAQACAADVPDDLYARINRITWGATPETLAQARQQGYEAWLQNQLKPPARAALPPEVAARIAALPISSIPAAQAAVALRERIAQNKHIQDPDEQLQARREANRAMRERGQQARERAVWLALYSPNQLQEHMTWFWMNHFNVWLNKGYVGVTLDAYEAQALRPRSLGKFRDLLAATLRSPAMLVYLDNAASRDGKVNENYARELLELHTLGVDGGYTQRDVQELARVLTGVGINLSGKPAKPKGPHAAELISDGLFEFNPARHDYGDKVLLGHTIKGRGWAEVEQALDILASHPATARHISRKLATFFVADTPPQALVDQLTRAYQQSEGDIASVLRVLFNSPAFTASLKDGKFKDPVHYVYSSLRLALHDQPPLINAQAVATLIGTLGQPLYGRLTPDGYPLTQNDWSGSGQLNARFEAARAIAAATGSFYQAKDEARPRMKLSRLSQAYAEPSPFAAWPATSRDAIAQTRNVVDANTYLLAAPPFMRR
ncbi:DUF1800 domain-containing protein [Bordetella genomosp. 12]|uniref:DUF1800 domain-containing protein n=1 Tax=Bordetella genomosp. 12 TaxID=463035 RepID=A0A261VNI6_9BORD|nr:DUF1800 domain-containing protein [Bordetella genomosp. 12]OZI74763.1 hypothetical protein CAL22_09940 [Bordetella genomosp. 12]